MLPLPLIWVSNASTTSCSSKPGPVPASESLALTAPQHAHRDSAPAIRWRERGQRGSSTCCSGRCIRRCDTHARRSRGWQRSWTRPPHHAAERRARLQPSSLAPHQDGAGAASSLHALHVQAQCSLLEFPASVTLRLAPCPGAASSRALPLARECVILAARTSCAREAPAACGGLGKARGSLQRPTPTGWITFSCRAPFHSYKVFSPQRHVCRRCTGRHGGAGEACRKLGCRPGNTRSGAKGLA